MGKNKPYKGQIIYSLNIGDGCRGRPQKIVPVMITKVGRKFFTTGKTEFGDGYRSEHNYFVESWKQVYRTGAPVTRLYQTKEEYEAEKLSNDIRNKIAKLADSMRFGQTEVPLHILKEVDALISPYMPKEESK